MDTEKILNIVTPPYGDAWVQIIDEKQEMIFYERMTAFAQMMDSAGKLRWVTLTVDDEGRLHEIGPGEVIFSPVQPETIISEKRKKIWGINK